MSAGAAGAPLGARLGDAEAWAAIDAVERQGTVVFLELFDSNPNANGKWTIFRGGPNPAGSGVWDAAGTRFLLTQPLANLGIAAFANHDLTDRVWLAKFRYVVQAGDNTGADGFVFHFYKDSAAYGVCGVGVGGSNAITCAGDAPIQGYGIEFDNWQNVPFDPVANHLALVEDHYTNQRFLTADARTEDGAAHDVIVAYLDGRIVVVLDRDIKINAAIPNPDLRFSGVGFSSATGGANNRHILEDFVLVELPGV